MLFQEKVCALIQTLSSFETNEKTFNPWKDVDLIHDINCSAPYVRCNNLKQYLLDRENAKFILIAEALSYQGGKFTGVAMTSERLLGVRTSNPNTNLGNNARKYNGFSENTATIVEKTLINDFSFRNIDFLKWNIYPFHPHKDNLLSNRTPTISEIQSTYSILKMFLDIFNDKKLIAVGNTSYNIFKENFPKYDISKVRHPANGGATEFKNQIRCILFKYNIYS